MSPAYVLGDEARRSRQCRAHDLLGEIGAPVGRQGARAQRATEQMREDPDLDRDRRRQPEKGEQERQPRERRLRVLIEDHAAAMEWVPGRELVKVDERDARRLPRSREKSRIARAPEAVYG